ncbi:hypothetical protein F2981_32725 (plasmid) [Sinorhizobium meliloti]|nr:hypothetical protein [Sinorhizobium meliloti]
MPSTCSKQASGKDALRLSTFAFDDLRASVKRALRQWQRIGAIMSNFVGTRALHGLAGSRRIAAGDDE